MHFIYKNLVMSSCIVFPSSNLQWIKEHDFGKCKNLVYPRQNISGIFNFTCTDTCSVPLVINNEFCALFVIINISEVILIYIYECSKREKGITCHLKSYQCYESFHKQYSMTKILTSEAWWKIIWLTGASTC